MEKNKAVQKFVELQHDKKVVLSELATLIILGAYQTRLWEDSNFFANLKPRARVRLRRTSVWFNAHTAKLGNFDQFMRDKNIDTTNKEKIVALKEKVTDVGGIAAKAVFQIRDFRFGETPWKSNANSSAIHGTIFMAKSETAQGEPVEEQIIEVDGGVNVDSSSKVRRLSRAVTQLIPKPENPLQNG
jgi:hypothetical protein